MATYTKFSRLSLAAKIRLREKFTSEIFYRRKYPDLRYINYNTLLCSDGLISYDELLSYFLSANTSLRERFTHQFAEHTFLGNAVCEHCKGMVSNE